MGGGLLQKMNRDTMSFATKLNYIKSDGKGRDVMKKPKSDSGKISMPGILKILKIKGIPTIFPSKEDEKDPENILQVVWDNGPVKDLKWETFDDLRKRVKEGWETVPKLYDPVSDELKGKIKEWIKDFELNKEGLLSANKN